MISSFVRRSVAVLTTSALLALGLAATAGPASAVSLKPLVAPYFSSVAVTGPMQVRTTATATVTGLVGGPDRAVSYQWQSSPNGSTDWAYLGGATEAPTLLIPFSQFLRYLRVTVTVSATGYSDYRRTSAGVLVAVPNTANAPRSVRGVAGDSSVLVSWTAPVDEGGGVINGYRVIATPKVGTATRSCQTPFFSSAMSCRVTGLVAGVAYRFVVRAHNQLGYGIASAPSAAVTPISITWTQVGRVVTAKFRPVSGATKYTEASTGATTARGECTVAGIATARRVTCVITLATGTSTLSVWAVTSSAVLMKATRVQTV